MKQKHREKLADDIVSDELLILKLKSALRNIKKLMKKEAKKTYTPGTFISHDWDDLESDWNGIASVIEYYGGTVDE